jgi:hypothetical protein
MAATCFPTEATWQQLTVGIQENSNVPCPRAGHSWVYDEENKVSILFGGASHEDGASNDTFILDNRIFTY